ncbi:hypothetical protein [Aurantiacibacter poecillastricola]|uniref:hypothetical protein n=1 Tax=Aurantiacibacter poecillastricola TaxID=3064385 RepID=UPI00273E46C6|nr:hypothetical protein [Aurantiacibacter sp. 219JJ12-13]MDP5261127.1 hypothetical protein [Aurantiacibacter sp. 219JJ12-13]
MILKRAHFAVALAIGCVASAGVAQDYDLDPNFGSTSLKAGFTPDPHTVRVQAGGSRDAQNASGECSGYISNAPDYRVQYDSGSFPLIISVDADSDTTLVVNAPDGSWYCDDDGGEGLNPMVRMANPQSGQYDIWVGTYADSGLTSATLYISEVSSQ